jgi:hypothetical protein
VCLVVLDHAINILAVAVLVATAVLGADVGAEVMRVELNQQKKGLPASFCRFM